MPADRLLALQDLIETAFECRDDKRNYLPDLQRYAPDVLSFANAADVLDMVQVFTGLDIAI